MPLTGEDTAAIAIVVTNVTAISGALRWFARRSQRRLPYKPALRRRHERSSGRYVHGPRQPVAGPIGPAQITH